MIFRFAALLLSITSYASAIEVSMIDMQDIMENHRIVTDSLDPYGGSSNARGLSLIKSKLKNLLVKTANDSSEWHEVQTTFLSKTSNYHQDRKHDEDATLAEGPVGFVVLNTNNDAYFDHPDRKVPIREGAFIRFNGSEPHRTVVNKGIVQLLGPFDLKSFEQVGWGGASPTMQPSEASSESPSVAPSSTTKAGKPRKATKSTKAPKVLTTKAPKVLRA